MRITRHAAVAVVLALSVAFGVAACAQPTSPPASPPIVAAPSASPSSAPAEVAAAIVQVGSASIAILADDGSTIEEFDYFVDDTDRAVGALTDAFGSPPMVGEGSASPHGPAHTIYSWNGFELRDSNQDAAFPDVNAFYVRATAATIGEVDVLGPGGTAVGSTLAEVSAQSYQDSDGSSSAIVTFWLDELVVEDHYADSLPAALSVNIIVDRVGDAATLITAPQRNWGA